jgi:hypothetical protein
MSMLVFSFILMFVIGMLLVSPVFGFKHHPTSFAQIDLANLTVRNTMDLNINSNSSMAEAPDQGLPSLQEASEEAPLTSPDQGLPPLQGGLDQQHREQQAQQR